MTQNFSLEYTLFWTYAIFFSVVFTVEELNKFAMPVDLTFL